MSIYDCTIPESELGENLNHETIVNILPEGFKSGKSLGTVEAIEIRENCEEMVVGYSRGVAIHYNLKSFKIIHTFYSHTQLEALHWYDDKSTLIAFQDGSTTNWNFDDEVTINSKTADILYGPMPCKPITSIHKVKDLKVSKISGNKYEK